MSNSNPLISIIIPVYNVEKYLRQCLDSVLSQTYTNYEVIMVDDGSTDSSYDICLEYSIKDSRFKSFQKENGGASSARNIGLDKADGKYVFFLDSDDWIDKNMFQSLLEIAEAEETDFVVSEAVAFDDVTGKEDDSKYSYHKKYITEEPYRMMREMMAHKEFHISICSILFSKDFFDNNKLRFVEGIMYEDLILSYQIYALANKAAHLHEPVYHRRYRENSVMTAKKSSRNFISAAAVYHKVVEFSESLPEERKNNKHIIRCTYNALNDYSALSSEEKRSNEKGYQELKKDILSHQAFGDKALMCRCKGYLFWVSYKIIQRLFIGDKPDYSIYINDNFKGKKKVLMLMSHMIGGGAERVAAQLINQMNDNSVDTKFILSADIRSNVVRSDLNDDIPLFLLREEMPKEAIIGKIGNKARTVFASLLCKIFEMLTRPVPAVFAELFMSSQYNREILFLRGLMLAEPELTVIAFLQPTIPITLLAAKDLPNRVIISERGNPHRLMKKRYGKKFIERYYTRADAVVFQTQEAKETYPTVVSEKGCVIPNPIMPDLPEPYHGDRNKFITTFCRISKQKNLPLLIDAFALLHKEYADYKLRIIGDAPNVEGIEVLDTIKKMIVNYGFQDSVIFEPFNANVHESIIKDAMYVNSSDYEGISNAMLEAMTIGMPVICTDCPVGGARATIHDGENGLLVPMNDPYAMYQAMKKIIDEKAFSSSLSYHAAELRERLSLKIIADRWLELV